MKYMKQLQMDTFYRLDLRGLSCSLSGLCQDQDSMLE